MGNATLRVRRPGPRVVAPDDVPVWPVDLAPARHMTLAEGLLEPGAAYRPHAHRTIEQVTYVLTGRVRDHFVRSRTRANRKASSWRPGSASSTLPHETIEFACVGENPARVLFVTSPPYPADHSDTIVLRRAPVACGRSLTVATRARSAEGGPRMRTRRHRRCGGAPGGMRCGEPAEAPEAPPHATGAPFLRQRTASTDGHHRRATIAPTTDCNGHAPRLRRHHVPTATPLRPHAQGRRQRQPQRATPTPRHVANSDRDHDTTRPMPSPTPALNRHGHPYTRGSRRPGSRTRNPGCGIHRRLRALPGSGG